jgi:hypothetical protein
MTTSPNRNTQANQEPITPVMDLRGGREGGREGGRGRVRGGVLGKVWEGGRYGCQNDGLDEAHTMVEKRRREEGLGGGSEGGREGGRQGLPKISNNSAMPLCRSVSYTNRKKTVLMVLRMKERWDMNFP